jgi:hypothetical protein
MNDRKLDRRSFLRKLGGWFIASAALMLSGAVPGLQGVKNLGGSPARFYRKLAG